MPRPLARPLWVPLALALLAWPLATALTAQSRIEYTELKAKPTVNGAVLYQTYCSSCHGPTAHGNGPAARLLTQPVPDLTLIAYRDGRFEITHVRAHITDANMHKGMPDWNSALAGVHSDHRTLLVVNNLARHLEAIQDVDEAPVMVQPDSPTTGAITFVYGRAISNPHGPTVYQDYCAACHGTTGMGNGRAARYLRAAVPDLTRIAERDGAFNSAHVLEHIQNVGSRKANPMPCWGQELRSRSNDPAANRMILANLAAYLETLQAAHDNER